MALLAIGCTDAVAPGVSLAEARARWNRLGPGSYSVTLTRACECLDAWGGPARITVLNGVPSSQVYTATGAPVAATNLFPTVEELFDIIEAAMNAHVARLDVRYDRVLGYPIEISIDQDAVFVDDEITYRAWDFLAH